MFPTMSIGPYGLAPADFEPTGQVDFVAAGTCTRSAGFLGGCGLLLAGQRQLVDDVAGYAGQGGDDVRADPLIGLGMDGAQAQVA